MHRQFAKPEQVAAESLPLPRDAARHFVTVLRLEAGDDVELFDGRGGSATFRLAADGEPAPARILLREGRLVLRRIGDVRMEPRRSTRIVLCPCVSKGRRMDWTIEKAVELGATRILPVASDNSVVRFAGDCDREEHRSRWERIAIDAARQCGASHLPEISPPAPLDAVLASVAHDGAALFAGGLVPDAMPFRDALSARRSLPPPSSAVWLVGPEGDFSPREYDLLRSAGVSLVSLGKLVLRTETAAVFGLCVLATEWPA